MGKRGGRKTKARNREWTERRGKKKKKRTKRE
jgi:hypothetical protein